MKCLAILALVLVFTVGLAGCALRVPVAELDTPEVSPATLNMKEVRGRWPRSPDEFQVSLSVIHALEEGPVVCQVVLKNVSQDHLRYATAMYDDGAYCRLECRGSPRNPPPEGRLICGNPGPYVHDLQPGETATETFYLRGTFVSLPPGPATAHFGWRVYRVVRNPGEPEWINRSLDLLFDLQGTQTVDILPATDENLAAMLNELEARYARIVKETEGRDEEDWYSSQEVDELVNTVDMCRRKEFVPLLLRAAERIPSEWARYRLVATVYESFDSPDEGFAALSELLRSPVPDAAVPVVSFWADHDRAHEASRLRREEELRRPSVELDAKQAATEKQLREFDLEREKLWRSSHRHPDWRLSDRQFKQLLGNTNVWVRTLLYAHYPDRCPAEWVETLFQDFNRTVRVPDGLEQFLSQLDDDDYLVRERATEKLIECGDEFAGHLWAIRSEDLPPEAAARLRAVLEKVEKPRIPSVCRRTISHIIWEDQPHERRLVEILRSSERPSLIGLMARKMWEQDQESKESFRRARSQEN